jgi:hypothetical protein
LIKRLPAPLGHDDVMRILEPVKGNARYNLIQLVSRHKRLPPSLTTDQMLSIIGNSSYYNRALGMMIERLPESLDYDGIIKIVSPLKGGSRYKAINLLARHNRVPVGLSEQQIQRIVESSTYPKRAIKLLTK